MDTRTRRGMRLALTTVGLAGLLVAVNAVPGAATPPSGLTNVTLARGTDLSVGTIAFQEGTDVVVAQITVIPGGSSGWHSHPGGAIVVVKQGELTLHRSVGSQCETTGYTAGQAFIERPGEVDDAVNTGTIPYVVFVTFPRVPQGGSARINLPDPGTCPGI
jgi:quercetin dioxygenase-like cupin family protein